MQNGANSTTRAVFLMSVPIFVELLLQLLVGNIDQFMVSRVSQEAVAAIGNGNQVMNLTIIVINVLCMASSILVSREIGAKDGRSLAQICTVSVAFIGAVSLAVTLMLVFGSGLFFRLLRVPEDILGQANDYLMIVGAFALVQGLYMVFAAVLRAYGFVREVMLTAVIMNALNIAGNAVLIGGLFGLPRLGIVGAAISTDIPRPWVCCCSSAFSGKRPAFGCAFRTCVPSRGGCSGGWWASACRRPGRSFPTAFHRW